MKDYEGMMSVVEYYGIPIVGSWLLDGFEIDNQDMHEDFVVAARTSNKLDLVLQCYQHAMKNTQLSDEELKEAKDAGDPMKTAQQTLKFRTRRVALASMIRVYLGWLYLETLRQPDKAFELWETGFFRHCELFNVSGFPRYTIPNLITLFSQLIYEKALDPDGVVTDLMISHLKHLDALEKVFYELYRPYYRMPAGSNVNLLLAKLYLRQGRKDEARKRLNEQFQSAMNICGRKEVSHIYPGYGALAGMLYFNEQLEKAKVASSLRRLDLQKPKPNEGTNGWYMWPFKCSARRTCEAELREISWGTTAFACTTCVDINFCQKCYDNLHSNTGKREIFVCSPGHTFIKTPPDGLDKIEDRVITMNGKSISIAGWLTEMRKEWRTGLCFKP
jgi:hypothetical protein